MRNQFITFGIVILSIHSSIRQVWNTAGSVVVLLIFDVAALHVHTGTRAVPEAAPNCMGGMTVVMTGEFETLTRDQVTDIVKRYGGKCVPFQSCGFCPVGTRSPVKGMARRSCCPAS
jgi:hypothetical protein